MSLEVSLISPEPVFPEWHKPYEELFTQVQTDFPLDAVEIVAWMQQCEAANLVMEYVRRSYEAAGGRIVSRTGDGAIPGVFLSEYSFHRQRGDGVRRRGFAVESRTGRRVSVGSWGWIDLLKVFGVVHPEIGAYQWSGLLGCFEKYASIPNANRMSFPRMWGITVPLVLSNSFIVPLGAPIATYHLRLTASDPTGLDLNFYDSVKTRYATVRADLERGQSAILIHQVMARPGYLELVPLANVDLCLDRIDRMPPL